MKLATYRSATARPTVGAVVADRVVDLAAADRRAGGDDGSFADMLTLMAAGDRGLDRAAELAARFAADEAASHPLAEIALLSPVPVPTQIRDFSAFPGHLRNAPVGMRKLAARLDGTRTAPEPPADEIPAVYRDHPLYYKGNRMSVVGPDADVIWPTYSDYMDFELEFGVFIGRPGRDIPAAQAHRHIFGYAIFNDVSARDAQLAEMRGLFGPAKGKDFDTGNVIGPWIVTPDEIPDPYGLAMAARVNGETWASGTSAGMLHSFEDMIAYVSRSETLHAGEFFGSGTMGGGCGLELDRYLASGDVIELEVERIGTLRNRIVRD